MNTCIKNGWITWHAFPHVAELEIMDESSTRSPLKSRSSIQFGIQMSNDLKRRFNKPDSRFISQNDVRSAPLPHPQVPGTTAAAIPILKKLGIEAFHILAFVLARASFTARQGVNVVSQPPNVPNIYLWRDPTSGETILNLNHRNGYGGWRTFDVGTCVYADA